ncbi:hypothetical protein H7I92_01875 [Mycobacterium riyadhense]|nr:hypothetical protein [Mycobacterium riyadhense]
MGTVRGSGSGSKSWPLSAAQQGGHCDNILPGYHGGEDRAGFGLGGVVVPCGADPQRCLVPAGRLRITICSMIRTLPISHNRFAA